VNSTAVILVYATAPDRGVADRLARILVEERLAACANILPGMRAIYRWQGQVESADEVVLILKTVATSSPALLARLRELHPYEEPCALEVPVTGGLPSYLAWIADAVRGPEPAG
jgi:periplasmic divalent cation tolerance protein